VADDDRKANLAEQGEDLRELFEIVRSMIAEENRPGTETALLIAVMMQASMATNDMCLVLGDIADSLNDMAAGRPLGETVH